MTNDKWRVNVITNLENRLLNSVLRWLYLQIFGIEIEQGMHMGTYVGSFPDDGKTSALTEGTCNPVFGISIRRTINRFGPFEWAVMCHELTHYWCFGKVGNNLELASDGSPMFENKLKELGFISNYNRGQLDRKKLKGLHKRYVEEMGFDPGDLVKLCKNTLKKSRTVEEFKESWKRIIDSMQSA